MDADHVREFTEASCACPDRPEPMSKTEVEFIAKMILDEVMELMATVHEPDESKTILKRFVDDSKDLACTKYESTTQQIADQADALVDVYYYSLNAACKRGVNLSKVFQVVHAANMAKRDENGRFIKREDGKIMKPPGWQPPDVEGEIKRQIEHGAWSS